ncbi:hypothetical protein SODALDRAFT_333595, partial [Sodiomyces alkalinus F11]
MPLPMPRALSLVLVILVISHQSSVIIIHGNLVKLHLQKKSPSLSSHKQALLPPVFLSDTSSQPTEQSPVDVSPSRLRSSLAFIGPRRSALVQTAPAIRM